MRNEQKNEQTEANDKSVVLVKIPPAQWQQFQWPAFQRQPNQHRVKEIAAGMRDGYEPGPITVYRDNGRFNIVDGGHRVRAYMLNRKTFGISRPIMALMYDLKTIDPNRTFVIENTKLRMNPINIIRADNRSRCCELVRELKEPGHIFAAYDDLYDYPVKPLSIIKVGVIMGKCSEELLLSSMSNLPVARAVKSLDAILEKNPLHWRTVVQFLQYAVELWGFEGRHLTNFGAMGFAYFLIRNRPVFFKDGNLLIKTTRAHVFERRGHQEEHEKADRSDYAKLASLKARWDSLRELLGYEATRDATRVALVLNEFFWRNRPKKNRVWRPELSM